MNGLAGMDGSGILEAFATLERNVGLESSVKIVPGHVLAERWLLTFSRSVQPDRVLELCRRFQMPGKGASEVQSWLPTTSFLHIGFESEQGQSTFKVYCEQSDSANDPAPDVQFRAFKWNPSSPEQHVVTHYCYEGPFSSEHVLACLTDKRLLDKAAATILPGIHRLVKEAFVAAFPLRPRLLKVREPGTSRYSLDLNIYDAGFLVGDYSELWEECAASFELPVHDWQHALKEIQSDKFGHFGIGCDRRGRPFLTLYHGARPLKPS